MNTETTTAAQEATMTITRTEARPGRYEYRDQAGALVMTSKREYEWANVYPTGGVTFHASIAHCGAASARRREAGQPIEVIAG